MAGDQLVGIYSSILAEAGGAFSSPLSLAAGLASNRVTTGEPPASPGVCRGLPRAPAYLGLSRSRGRGCLIILTYRLRMDASGIDAALNFLQGSPERQALMAQIEKLYEENREPNRSIQIVRLFYDVVGMEAYEEARLVADVLSDEEDNMSADQLQRLIVLLRPYMLFKEALQNLEYRSDNRGTA